MNVKKEQILHIMKLKNKNKGFVLCWMLLIVGVLGSGKDLLEIWRDSKICWRYGEILQGTGYSFIMTNSKCHFQFEQIEGVYFVYITCVVSRLALIHSS